MKENVIWKLLRIFLKRQLPCPFFLTSYSFLLAGMYKRRLELEQPSWTMRWPEIQRPHGLEEQYRKSLGTWEHGRDKHSKPAWPALLWTVIWDNFSLTYTSIILELCCSQLNLVLISTMHMQREEPRLWNQEPYISVGPSISYPLSEMAN